MPDPEVDVGFLHIGDAVTLLYGVPLRRIGPDFTVAMAEGLMDNAKRLAEAGWALPVRAYHKACRGTSPLNALPRGEDQDGPVVGVVTAVGVDDERGLLRCDVKITDRRALRYVKTAWKGQRRAHPH